MTARNPGVALVTGGSGGIGAAVVNDLLAAGYEVVNIDRAAAQTSNERLNSFEADLTDGDQLKTLVAEIAAKYDITTLVHNAGVLREALMEDVQEEDFEFLSALHLKSLITLGQGCLPAMKKANFGRIVIISSRAVLGLRSRTSYSSTKAAQLGLTRTWAMELGQYGVTVNAIAPGPITTQMLRDSIPEGDPMEEKLAQSLPVKRLGLPGDISRVVMFLASPESGFITGQTLYVCGGASLGSLAL
ncbi:MAG: SDR family oxidoreductase [Proteobacteria bacterium]|nr:SDR family oxidoreductase [Pseudomonadota bacterium]